MYRSPQSCTCAVNRGDLSVDGRGQTVSVALAPSTGADGMSVECRLELCAELIAPSTTCAQLHLICIFTMLIRVVGVGAQVGVSNAGRSAAGPIYTQTKPPASCVEYAVCLTRSGNRLSGASLAISSTLPSTSNFQPMIQAAQPALLIAAQHQGGAAVRQCAPSAPSRPAVSRNSTRSSPSRRIASGGASGSMISSDRQAGIQCRRMIWPIGASPSTRHSRSFSSGVNMANPR